MTKARRVSEPAQADRRRHSDGTSELTEAIHVFSKRHPSSHTPTTSDLAAIKALASFVSVRSSAIVATCVVSLWDCRLEAERAFISTLAQGSPERARAEADSSLMGAAVALACVEKDE